ncbi:MAG: glycine cleavage system protein GcvH [Fretibacterium sp.]|nr:glycine cleavage system protein GcvH [Fretibacterium sp.]
MRAPFFSADVRYTKTNEWGRRCGDRVRAGIDDYSQSALGDAVAVELPEEGTWVTAGSAFGSIEATKAVSDLKAPVSGRVTAVNRAVTENPGLVNADPFGEGWLIEIAPSDPAELDALMDAETYKAWLRSAARRS